MRFTESVNDGEERVSQTEECALRGRDNRDIQKDEIAYIYRSELGSWSPIVKWTFYQTNKSGHTRVI